jgi:hypothetical protein
MTRTYVRIALRPMPFLKYEQMFPSHKNSTLAQRTLGALRLTRSFLLLEDDYDVDWEVDLDESLTQKHPHRASLRGPGSRSRRSGEPTQRNQFCLSPVDASSATTRGRLSASPSECGTRRFPRSGRDDLQAQPERSSRRATP